MALMVSEKQHQRKLYYPPGYCIRRANYGFDVYREPETSRGFLNDACVGGYRPDEKEIALKHAWADWDEQTPKFRENRIWWAKESKRLIRDGLL